MENGADAEARAWANAEALGFRLANLRALVVRIEADFSAEHWGFGQFGDIDDLRLRAVVSDQIYGAVEAIRVNLLEARVHEMDFNSLSAAGLRMPISRDDLINDTRVHMHVVGVFRAFGSTLDCLAAVAIGVLRIPRSIQRADVNDLVGLDPGAGADTDQQGAWQRLKDVLDAQRAGPPEGWLEWSLHMRNLLTHRARQMNVMLPRPPRTRLILPWRVAVEATEFDLYFRRRPWLPDMDHLADDQAHVQEAWLQEPASQTIRGLLDLLNDLVESVSELLLAVWSEVADEDLALAAPVARWQPIQVVDPGFDGIAPAELNYQLGAILVNPRTADRIVLAERLRLGEHLQ